MNCKNCNKELILTPGRRKKEFCSNNCRVYFWNKLNKKVKSNNKPENKKQIEDSRNKISEASEKVEYPLSKREAAEVKNVSADAKKPFMSDAIMKKLGIK